MTTRILIFPNKAWEAAPLVGAFQNDQARPPRFPDFETPPQVAIPLSDGSTKTVAARLALKTANATAEVWCIQDLMDPTKSASSSEEKARVLPYVTANGAPPSLVIAFGTAATADVHSYNGCVVIGSSAFVHNPYAAMPNPESRWRHPDIGKLLDSSSQPINAALFGQLGRELRALIEICFLRPPLNPADPPTLILSPAYVALSSVNVTNQNNYVWVDPEASRAFEAAEPKQTSRLDGDDPRPHPSRRAVAAVSVRISDCQPSRILQHGIGAQIICPEFCRLAQRGRCARLDDAHTDGLTSRYE